MKSYSTPFNRHNVETVAYKETILVKRAESPQQKQERTMLWGLAGIGAIALYGILDKLFH